MNNSMLNREMQITQAGLDQLKSELAQIQDVRRPALVERLALARSMGDLSENSDYQSAREDLTFMDGRISELEELIKTAQVVKPSQNNQVEIGHAVTVKVNSHDAVFHIVGEWEADPKQYKISHSSPLGQALVGKKVGDKVEVAAPAGKLVYTLVSIS